MIYIKIEIITDWWNDVDSPLSWRRALYETCLADFTLACNDKTYFSFPLLFFIYCLINDLVFLDFFSLKLCCCFFCDPIRGPVRDPIRGPVRDPVRYWFCRRRHYCSVSKLFQSFLLGRSLFSIVVQSHSFGFPAAGVFLSPGFQLQ